jgi:hypothetical protein
MSRTRTCTAVAITLVLPLAYLAGADPDAPAGLALVPVAHAVVGAPLTPVSAAGVARRTTRRVVVASTSASQAAAASAAATQPAPAAQRAPAAAPRPAGAPPAGAIVTALPAGCKAEAQGGVEYQNCGGVYYRAAFQGNNLVFVVQ